MKLYKYIVEPILLYGAAAIWIGATYFKKMVHGKAEKHSNTDGRDYYQSIFTVSTNPALIIAGFLLVDQFLPPK